jgi:hypothetical protein
MRTIRTSWLLVTVALSALVAGSAGAQGRGPALFRFGSEGMLLAVPAVQTELKLTDEQKRQAADLLQKQRADLGEFVQRLQSATAEDRSKMLAEWQADQAKKVAAVLNPDQQKRLHQLSLQQQGFTAMVAPAVQTDLKLTAEQKARVDELLRAQQMALQNLFQGGGGITAETRQKLQALQKETNDKLRAVLTDEQKTRWKEMLGTPFNFPAPPPR